MYIRLLSPIAQRLGLARNLGTQPPHPFAIADTAYRHMMREWRDQAFIPFWHNRHELEKRLQPIDTR